MAETSRPAAIQLSEIGAYLGPGTKANGKLLFEGATTIEGEIDGEILVHGNVTIGEHANIKGKIVATSALIRGKVTADIQVDKRIEIQPPGVVIGDVVTQSLVIGDGAILEGHCSMRREKEGKVLPLVRQEASGGKSEESSS
ncbi:MAG: polymer-forming cytoskeletal protein [Deltaproteobacteria bacterium]|nr:polymer-forming cytoskeletal protein [Deltaproteobacteria bacterium]